MNLDSLQNLDPRAILAIIDLLYELAAEIENRFYPVLHNELRSPSDNPDPKPPDRYPPCPPSDSIPF
jgi:hypothetical protein